MSGKKHNTVIPVNDTYRIELDQYGWQISRWRTKSNEEAGGRFEGYRWYRTLSDACVGLAQFVIHDQECHGSHEIKNALADFTHTITAAIEKAGIGDSWPEAQRNEHERTQRTV